MTRREQMIECAEQMDEKAAKEEACQNGGN